MNCERSGGCAEARASLEEIFRGAEDVLLPQRIPVEQLVRDVNEALLFGLSTGLDLDFILWLLHEPEIAQPLLLFVEESTFRVPSEPGCYFDGYSYLKVLYYGSLVAQATGEREMLGFWVHVIRRGLARLSALPSSDWRDEWELDRLGKFLQQHSPECGVGSKSCLLDKAQRIASELGELSVLDHPERSVALRGLVERIRRK